MASEQGWKAALAEIARRGQVDLQTFVDGLDPAERSNTGTGTEWSVGDLVNHLCAWVDRTALWLRAAAAGGAPPPEVDETEFNEAELSAGRGRTLQEVLERADRAFSDLAAGLAACSEADLRDPDRFPSRNGRALGPMVLGNAYQHPVEHYAHYYLQRGDTSKAVALNVEAVATVGDLFGRGELYSYALYNLACIQAKSGHHGEALEGLGQALALTPQLVPWAGQDPDLLALHSDPAFIEMTSGAGAQ